MMRRASVVALMLCVISAGTVLGADPKSAAPSRPGTPLHPGLQPLPPPPQTDAHATPELDCRACHQREHGGIIRMYLGAGGRGTPSIPSHMAELRVECVACHVVPKETPAAANIVGQTFKVGEQACLGCHGEQYRGMLGRWTSTITKMREIVQRKLGPAREALAQADRKNAKTARVRKLLDDAEYNIRFVELGRGAHNVFYAADLLKLSNTWVDDAMRALGKEPVKADDALVRGGYCAVLCHEQAGVKIPATVMFGEQKLPHGRHVTEFGATCTACHSADVHKAMTANAADCASCHHSPANERCESCHKAQSAFYRGTLDTTLAKVEPNVMVNAVGCTGCHDLSKKHSRQAVNVKCIECHDKSYAAFTTEWTTGLDGEMKKTTAAIHAAEAALAKGRKAGRKSREAEQMVKEARDAVHLVRRARGAHNPGAAEALLEAARKKAGAAAAQLAGGK
jgi:hypothetical protein